VTASGLVYEKVRAGGGPMPTEASTVSVHYVGTLIDGSTFDSSRDRGEPAKFAVKQVIQGWYVAAFVGHFEWPRPPLDTSPTGKRRCS
jgi:FKBP-type peptidyl-prolyl cis-trans isomerase